jgi:hypothetical protein
MKLFSCDHYVLPLLDGHRFPMEKYRLLRARGLPVAISMAGGYAHDVQDVVDVHFTTVQIAAELSRA